MAMNNTLRIWISFPRVKFVTGGSSLLSFALQTRTGAHDATRIAARKAMSLKKQDNSHKKSRYSLCPRNRS